MVGKARRDRGGRSAAAAVTAVEQIQISQLLLVVSEDEHSACNPSSILTVYYSRGFKRKGARVRIITFRDTTRLQSKSNRCI